MPGYVNIILCQLHMSDTQCPLCLLHLYNDFMIQIIASSWHYNEESSYLVFMFKILEIQLKYVLHVLSDTSSLGMFIQTIGYHTHTHSIRTTVQIKTRHFSFWSQCAIISRIERVESCIISIISDQRKYRRRTHHARYVSGWWDVR